MKLMNALIYKMMLILSLSSSLCLYVNAGSIDVAVQLAKVRAAIDRQRVVVETLEMQLQQAILNGQDQTAIRNTLYSSRIVMGELRIDEQQYTTELGEQKSSRKELLEFARDNDPDDHDEDGINDTLEQQAYQTNIITIDSDGDGISDADEVIAGTDPNLMDSDADGLNDYHEITVYHTFADDPDTDGDGVSDGDEVAAGSNPLDRLAATLLILLE